MFGAWEDFKRGKKKKLDVKLFGANIKSNIFNLHKELKEKTYQHSPYVSFYVKDPKLRNINKATVKDRVLHHAIFVILYRIFDRIFIFDSYSSRNDKGTHRAAKRLHSFASKVSKNNTRSCFILKCDIRKFFDSVDREILTHLLEKQIEDENTIWLLGKIIKSFQKGIPLGNVTSQIFANIYLNELDQFVKRTLKIKYYIRYCDDFVILSGDKMYLESLIAKIDTFLNTSYRTMLGTSKDVVSSTGLAKCFAYAVSAKYSSHAEESTIFIICLFPVL